MARTEDSFTVALPTETVHEACIVAAGADDWKIHDSGVDHFYLRQNISFLDRLFRFPSDCVIMLKREKKNRTTIELHGHIRGFGPLQRRRVIKAVAEYRAALEKALG